MVLYAPLIYGDVKNVTPMKTFGISCVLVFYEITNTELVCKLVHCVAESAVDLSFV